MFGRKIDAWYSFIDVIRNQEIHIQKNNNNFARNNKIINFLATGDVKMINAQQALM